MDVPFLDLKAQFQRIQNELAKAVLEVCDDLAFAGGPHVERFENSFARYCGCRHAIGVGSGTEALWLALMAAGVGPGDEVVTVPNTFIATAEAITYCGARPVFVDVDPRTCTLDVEQLRSYLEGRFAADPQARNRLKAMVPVHLYGQMAAMEPVLELGRRFDLRVIEDACQAHGAEQNGKRAGSFGDLGCFSFYPGKNLGAYGEAGAVVTNDDRLAEKIRMFRDHGQAQKYVHRVVGWNARMDGIQGAVLSVKLPYLNRWNKARRRLAKIYDKRLGQLPTIVVPQVADGNTPIYHLYVIGVPDREKWRQHLETAGVHCGIHYPLPLHLQPAYSFLGLERGCYPVAEQWAGQCLSLPIYPELDPNKVHYVCDQLESLATR